MSCFCLLTIVNDAAMTMGVTVQVPAFTSLGDMHIHTHTLHIRTHIHTHTHKSDSISHKKKMKDTLPFATIWMKLEDILLGEISQLEKDKTIISLICGI